MLPFCERHLTLPRTDVSPVWTRSWPIAKEPTTLANTSRRNDSKPGSGRLKSRKTHLQLAKELGVSPKTLWGWETNRWQPSTLWKKRIGVGML